MSQQMHRIIGFAVLILILLSCNNKSTVFDQCKELPAKGWHKDSVVHFETRLENNTPYKMLVNIRNRGDYKTQNMWLFINYERPDKSIKKDSFELYLADNQGKWLGSGFGSLYEMQLEIIPTIKFYQSGVYKFDIKHGMRDTTLVGINDIGLVILKNK